MRCGRKVGLDDPPLLVMTASMISQHDHYLEARRSFSADIKQGCGDMNQMRDDHISRIYLQPCAETKESYGFIVQAVSINTI